MNRSESKYFHTALLMDEALIALLEKKDLEYITVKEICEKAGVNRSTFYLHYETVGDLVNEALETIDRRFQSYFAQSGSDFVREISGKPLEELVLTTGDYLKPYLEFIRDNKHVYRAAFRNPGAVQAYGKYEWLKKEILSPILGRFAIPEGRHPYYIAYYIEGIAAIIKLWLNTNCQDPIETIAAVIEECIRAPGSIGGGKYGN